LHVACYAILAALFFWALAAVKSQLLRVLLVFVVVVSLGMILEFLQTRIPGRFGTLLDVLLNIFGTLIGIASALLLL
jgi:VanZ family protein